MANFIKEYYKNIKYNKKNNNFNIKIRIFKNIYLKINILFKQYTLTFFTILKKKVNKYYYNNIIN